MHKLEKLRREINKLDYIIKTRKARVTYWNDIPDKTKQMIKDLENFKLETKDFINKKENLTNNFNKLINNLPQEEINNWIQQHKNTISEMIKFSNSIFSKNGNFLEERIILLYKIKENINSFDENKYFPYVIFEEYNSFFDMVNLKKDIDISFINNEFISKIELLQNEINKLKSESFNIAAILDKMESWGASKTQVENTENDYDLVQEKIKKVTKEANNLIKETYINSPQIIKLWIYLNLYTLNAIALSSSLEENYKYNDIRITEAIDTFYKWYEITPQNASLVNINPYYLSDYTKFFNIVKNNINNLY